ncbi:stage III sporulation protein AB [Anaerosporobacter mobilis DSM 15930]|jgi:stage III sporulation protein AB|uniref:Stage III sporulation protein AB n=1 Tax=Anaerosporobacter mobilis DSM 15930 TaxID=1120996 RepID=A0A1M7M3Z4_9FIRM|nr:stage III sporulation protein AB [Anaerosporobacter mobilis]SHM84924.1 stage III sporulation protein AB [Anaerosporobacter mobilis DSM 15930]
MVAKIIGAILVIVSSGGIGLYFSIILKERISDLKELNKLIIILRGEIRYASTPLPEAVSNLAYRTDGEYRRFLLAVAEEIDKQEGKSFGDIWNGCVEKELVDTSLNKKDKLLLTRLGENLGYLDKEMQLNTIDLYITQIQGELDDAVDGVKEKVRLYNMLGVMAGIFITIVLI